MRPKARSGRLRAPTGNPTLPKLIPLLLCLVLSSLVAPPVAAAEEDAQLRRIAQMQASEIDQFVGVVTAAVGQDSLKLRSAGARADCLELTRLANSFALGYRYLAAAREALAGRTGRDAVPVRDKVLQTRVLTFAARVRTDEWLQRSCRSYRPPGEFADEPRYQPAVPVATAEFTEAVIEARQAAEINLAVAVAAGVSGKCPAAVSAARGITLFIPYVDKLLADVATRPQALGPRASRRALQNTRSQLIAALDRLEAEFGARCGGGGAAGPEPAP